MNTFQTSRAGERKRRAPPPEAAAHLGGWDVGAGVCMIHFLTSDAVQMSRLGQIGRAAAAAAATSGVFLSLCKDSNVLSTSSAARCRQEAFSAACVNIRK